MYFFHPSQGKLTGKGIEDQLPTIAIVTHYDSFGIAPVSMNLLYKFSFRVFPHCVSVNMKSIKSLYLLWSAS